jgi:hypothetical protein
MSEINEQIATMTASIDKAIETWQEQMDMWSQEPVHRAGESPKFEESFWDKLHHLRGLDPDQAKRYDWVLGLGY